ncbi:hypothetical protein NQ317_002861 [Molorchus minor]|uniref:Uncharacterized protein n=1 Tax=Molorchus minor TaxID=1323400 RepID=A0ABQ9JX19_9CUCU|nr:hypothetical protein NQ317_002861 [Molorchus minor]
MGSEQFENSAVPWMKDEISTQSTSLPDLIEEESNKITTVVIFVISAVFAITLLFVIAIFIDCRQQKLQKIQSKKPRKILRMQLPLGVVGRAVREDQERIVDRMEQAQPSTSNVIV